MKKPLEQHNHEVQERNLSKRSWNLSYDVECPVCSKVLELSSYIYTVPKQSYATRTGNCTDCLRSYDVYVDFED